MKRTIAFLAALLVCLATAPFRVTAGAPDVRVVDLKGLDTALAGHRGQAVLLNFWATWCEPCVAELPELQEVGREFGDRNAVVLTVSYDLMIPDVTPEGALKLVQA